MEQNNIGALIKTTKTITTMKISNIEEIRTDLKVQKEQVIQISSMSELEYHEFLFEIGIKVLEANIIDPQNVSKIAGNKMYWNFFRLQWLNYEKIAIRFVNRRQGQDAENEYKRRMSELIHSRRMWLSLQQFFTMFKII